MASDSVPVRVSPFAVKAFFSVTSSAASAAASPASGTSTVAASSSCAALSVVRSKSRRPCDVAASFTAPTVVVTPWLAFAMYAATSFEISLCATVIAIETPPATPPNAAPSEAVPAVETIVAASSAISVTLRALMPPVFVPSM